MSKKIGGIFEEVAGKGGNSPAGSSGGASGSSGGNKSPSGASLDISEDQRNIVRAMQNVMSKLSQDIITNTNKNKITVQNPDDLVRVAGKFSNTAMGYPGSSAGDGIWGGNTQKALDQVVEFVFRMKLQGITIVSGPKWNEAKDDVIIPNAKANIENLSKIFEQLNLQKPEEARQMLSDKLDDVGRELGSEQAVDPLQYPFTTKIPVLTSNLTTLLRFFDFVSSNGMFVPGVACEPLAQKAPVSPRTKPTSTDKWDRDPWAGSDSSADKDGLYDNIARSIAHWDNSSFYKLAEKIKNSNIIKVADVIDPATNEAAIFQANNTDPDLGAVEQRTFNTGICLNQFEQLIYWFATRANNLANALYYLLTEGEYNPITKKKVTQSDYNLALKYNNMMISLNNQWSGVKKSIEKAIIESGSSNKPYITKAMISGSLYSRSPQQGAARTRPGSGGNSGGVQSYTTPGATDGDQGGIGLERGPLSDYMDFDNLLKRGFELDKNAHDSLARLLAHIVKFKDWSGQTGITWQTLADMYSKEESDVGANEDIKNITKYISNVIISFFNNWKSSSDWPDEVSRSQFELLQKWMNALRSTSAAASRQTSETGGGGRGQVRQYPISKRR